MAANPKTAPVAGMSLLLSAILWGVAGTATKYALRRFDPLMLLTVELAAGAAMLWLVLLIRGYRPPPSWRRVLLLGLFEPALAYLGDTLGLARTSASNGAVITGTEAVFVVVLAALFLREQITPIVAVAIVMALAGFLVLESGGPVAGPGVGDLLVLAGALSAATYTIVARGGDEDEDSLAVTAHQFGVALIVILPLAAAAWWRGTERFPSAVPGRYWLAAAAVGVAGFACSFLLYNRAILTTTAGASAVIVNLIPAFGLLSAVLWLGDRFTPARVVAISLIGLSVATFATVEFAAGTVILAEPGLPETDLDIPDLDIPDLVIPDRAERKGDELAT